MGMLGVEPNQLAVIILLELHLNEKDKNLPSKT